MANGFVFRRDRTSGKNVLSHRFGVIHGKSDRIPQLRRILPLINKPRLISLQKTSDFRLRELQVINPTLRTP